MNTKKIIGIVAVMALIAIAMVGAGAAEEVTWYVGAGNDTDVVAVYDTDTTTLTISPKDNDGPYQMEDYTSSGAPWYKDYRILITSVVINEGVSNIGDYAFDCCDGLTSISFPKCTTIGECSFSETALSSVYAQEVTTIGTRAFGRCYELTSVSFPKCTTLCDYAFLSCSNLPSLSIPECTTINDDAFRNCTKLKYLVVNKEIDSTSVQNVENDVSVIWYLSGELTSEQTFPVENCYVAYLNGGSLKVSYEQSGYTLPTADDFETSGFVGWNTKMDGTGETRMVVSAGETVYAIWGDVYTVTFDMQGHGTQVEQQVVERWNKVTEPSPAPTADGYKFKGWYEEAECLNKWNFDAGVYENTTLYAKWVSTATEWNIGFANEEDVTAVYDTESCTLTISPKDDEGSYQMKYFADYGPWYDVYGESITSVVINEGVSNIGGRAFGGCTSLNSVDAQEVTTIDVGAFAGCTDLTTVSFPKCTSLVSYAFVGCSGLASISVPDCTVINTNVFTNCENLKYLVVNKEIDSTSVQNVENYNNIVWYVSGELISEPTFPVDNCYVAYLNGFTLQDDYEQSGYSLPSADDFDETGAWFKEWNTKYTGGGESQTTVVAGNPVYAIRTDTLGTTVVSETSTTGGLYKFSVPADIVLKNSTDDGSNIVYGDVSITPITYVSGKDIVMRLDTASDAGISTETPKVTFAVHSDGDWKNLGKYAFFTMNTYSVSGTSVGSIEKGISDNTKTTGEYTDTNNIIMHVGCGSEQNAAVEKYIGFTTTKMPTVTGEYTGNLTFVIGMEDAQIELALTSSMYESGKWYSDSEHTQKITSIIAKVGDEIKCSVSFDGESGLNVTFYVKRGDNTPIEYYYVNSNAVYGVYGIGIYQNQGLRTAVTEESYVALEYGDKTLEVADH